MNRARAERTRSPRSDTATTALYRNDGKGNFEDVTAGSGLDVSLYGMGAAVGDYDNDGRVDVFISALGTNRLFHNEGDGKFRDVTARSGVGGDERRVEHLLRLVRLRQRRRPRSVRRQLRPLVARVR